MHYFQAVILSIVEGLTEFLPISSTGHLIITSRLLRLPSSEFLKSFEIIIQLGAILAVVFLYRRALLTSFRLWPKIILAFLPTGILGLIFYHLIKQYLLGSVTVVLWSLFLGGLALLILEKIYKQEKAVQSDVAEISNQQALLIGLFQSLAMIPGVSRAAATIFGGMFLGLKRKTAVEFSFFLAVPTMLAATGLDLVSSWRVFNEGNIGLLAVGFAGSFFVAILAVKGFLRYIKNNNFVWFGLYRILAALVFWFLIFK